VANFLANPLTGREKNSHRQHVGGAPTNCQRQRRAELKKVGIGGADKM